MHDPIRSRNRAATVFFVALAVFLPALVLPRSGDDLTVRKLILFSSLAVVLISAVWLIVRWDEARRLIRLRAGIGVIARWTIDRARWAWFQGRSHEWDQQKNLRPNDVDFTQGPGPDGLMEIVVTSNAIRIGTHFYPLELNARITVRSDWMEIYDVIPKTDGSPVITVLRLPLQPGKESLATDIQQAYQRKIESARKGVHQLVWIALLAFVGLPLITATIWLIAKLTGWIA